MHVNFYATLRPLAGGKTIEIPVSTPTPAVTVLESATNQKIELATEMWQSRGVLRDHIKVFINGRQSVHLSSGLDTLVHESDTLDVFPPVGGGSSAA
jgi:molybdopterin synthase sulfur carrier subunit